MATINKTPDEINQSISFADDLRKLKTPNQISEGIDGVDQSIQTAFNNNSSVEADPDKIALRDQFGRLKVADADGAQYAVNFAQLNVVKITADNSKLVSDAVAAEVDGLLASINAITADPQNAVTSIFIPPNAMTKVTGNPTLSVASSRMAAWLLNKENGGVSFLFRAPSHWSTINATFLIANTAANAGNISLSAEVHNWSVGESINQTPSGSSVIHSVASQLWVSEAATISNPITIDPAKYSTIRISRFGASGSDTLPNSIALLGVILEVSV